PPLAGLAVEILQGRKGPRGKEGRADKLNRPFDAPLLVAPARRTKLRREMIVPRQLQQPRMKLRLIATTVQNDLLHVVVLDIPDAAAKLIKGIDMSPQEILQSLIEEETQKQSPRIGQRDDKARQP